MTVIGVDDTDSRNGGMCTTYVADTIARRLSDDGVAVEEAVLLRCNPAVEHKTRGNAAVALHTDATPGAALEVAADVVETAAVTDDPRTNPGVVVAPDATLTGEGPLAAFTRAAVTDHLTVDDARERIDAEGFRFHGWKNGRGLIGALAAVGARATLQEWTHERITYRPTARWGTDRRVDADSTFDAAKAAYPRVWDTVDRGSGEIVCVPHTPGPVLYGIRGDGPDACRRVADRIESEPVDRARTFRTNQGTDGHLRTATVGDVRDGRAYRVDGRVDSTPVTRRGGHVFFRLVDDEAVQCVAFEPTKRFRDRVRALRVGDRVTACGEVTDGTLKLEKFAVRQLQRIERVVPTCESCGNTMESAGTDQGYRCRDCARTAAGTVEEAVERELEPGWYEVPPRARRHIAKPLVRGGFDAPTHPER